MLRLSIRLLAAWLILSLALLMFGPRFVSGLLPLFTMVIEVIQRDFIVTLQLTRDSGQWLIRMQPFAIRPIALSSGWVIPTGTTLGWFSVHVDHTLVPLALYLTAVSAWPIVAVRELLGRVALSVPLLFGLLALGAPVHLAGLAQMFLVEQALARGAAFHEPWLVTCMIFLESGGRWLLPLVASMACCTTHRSLGLASLAARPAARAQATGRVIALRPVHGGTPASWDHRKSAEVSTDDSI